MVFNSTVNMQKCVDEGVDAYIPHKKFRVRDPRLAGTAEGMKMSHETAVGKINQDEILYLMARGLTEDEATATIVRGFMSVDIPGLPPELKEQIDLAVAQTNEEVM